MDKRFYFIAGEKSGDLHGAELMKAMRGIRAKGVGGPDMQAEGLVQVVPYEDFQVMGFTDVLISLPHLIPHFYTLLNKILEEKPDGVIFIDYPGFNLRLALALRKNGYKGKLIHYIAPSVWAWKKGRIHTMAKTLDLLLTIFPFEPPYFENTGLKTVYVGNPLMKNLSPERARLPLLALFPGSRKKEILRNLPVQIEAAKLFGKEVAISVTDGLEKEVTSLLKGLPYRLVPEQMRFELMQTASYALAKSGTVTLELALRGCPTVVHYQLTPLNYFLARYFFRISLPHFALPNILLKEPIFPERYHTHIDPRDLFQMAINIDPLLIQKKATELQKLLTTKDASQEAAKEILQLW